LKQISVKESDNERASIAITRISYRNSVRLSVTPGTNASPGEIESSCFHRMIV